MSTPDFEPLAEELERLRPMQRLDTITLQEALDLFRLPRNLGNTAEGEEIVINIGRFGPYVRFGSKFASLKKEDDPYTIELDRALQLIADKKASEVRGRALIGCRQRVRVQVQRRRDVAMA